MKRVFPLIALTVAAVVAPVLRADVKTTEKTTTKFGGVLSMLSKFGGGGGDEGVASTVSIKGNRKYSGTDRNAEIIDLTEEKVYRLDIRKKEYKVLTFDQIRKEWQDMKAEADKNAKQLQEAQGETAPQDPLEFSATVKETGQTKSVAGENTREVVVTLTGVHKGKTLEEGGGMVLTNTLWLARKIASVDEIREFDMRYVKAILGSDDAAAVMQQMTMLFAMIGNAKPAMDQMMAENRKLQGTQLASTIVMETVRAGTAAGQQAAAPANNSQQSNSGGGGIGGMLARRMGGNKAAAADNAPRQTTFSSTREILTLAPSASAEDVAIPAGFKEKK
jgi:hypothetical protein